MKPATEALIGDLGYALKQATYGKATVAKGYCPSDAVAISFEVFMGEAEKLGRREEANLLKRVACDED